MKKALVSVLLVILAAVSAFGSSLFEYRGIFPAGRATDAKITNYMLLKKDSRISFEIEEPGLGISERIKIARIKLTSDEKINFEKADGIKELDVAETGIYEITLIPATQEPGEMRFILKVSENGNKASSPVVTVVAPPPTIAVASTPVIAIQPAITLPVKEVFATPTIAVPVLPVVKETQVASITLPNPDLSANLASGNVLLTASGSSAPVAGQEPVLLSPKTGFFLNPFNGFKFSLDDVNFLSGEKQRQMFRVFLRSNNGRELPVDGTFFSPEPDTLVFLPAKVVPGAIYNLEIADETLINKKLYSVPAFPDLAIDFFKSGSDLKARISWPQSIDLLPNPTGQMLSLTGSLVVVSKGGTQLLQLVADENLLPFGAIDRISYRAQPCELELTMPIDLFGAEDCVVEIKAAVDGGSDKVQAKKAQWKNSGIDDEPENASDDELFSKTPAAVIDEVASAAVPLKPEEIIARESMPGNTGFAVERSFSILENVADGLVSWPQDAIWDDQGGLWVLDSQKRRVCHFNSDGTLSSAFGSKGETPGAFGLPAAIARRDGTLYVSDTTRHSIHLFAEDGTYKSSITTDPASGIQIDLPGGICFRKNEMWVSDRGLARIFCFNDQGGLLGSFGSTPTAPIVSPSSVRADADFLFILEKNGLVKKFSPMGHFEATFQSGCSEGLGFDIDPWGGIWVCDSQKFQVLRFARNGSLLATIKAPPAPKPWLPTAVTVRKDGKIAVTDAQNKMLHIFAPVE